jgi:hypothetical protein
VGRLAVPLLILGLLVGAPRATTPGTPGDSELEAGIAAVAAREYSSAIGTLSAVVRRLGKDPARNDDVVAAYLYLGVAFAGLGQESPARSQFAQALLRRPDATLDVPDPPALALEAFAAAKREATPMIAATAEQKKKPKIPLLLAGLAVAGAGVGVAASAQGDDAPAAEEPIDPPPPSAFQPFFRNGNPFLTLGSGDPASGSTIVLGAAIRPRLVFIAQGSDFSGELPSFPQLRATVDLTSGRGSCWHSESPAFALPSGVRVELLMEFSGRPSCPVPVTTFGVDARLFDLVTGGQISLSTYRGGYRIVP